MRVLIAAISAFFIITSCGSNKHEYPSDVVQNFMNSCQETSGGNQSMCSCLLDKIQEKYSYEDFTAMEAKMQLGQTPQDFLEFVQHAKKECGNNSNFEAPTPNSEGTDNTYSAPKEDRSDVDIPGTYTGTDNVGMESTIILRSGGSLTIIASVGDGTPDYGSWTGTADDLSLYHTDAFGNEELIGNAKVTEQGLRIIGGQFYSRQ